MDLSNDVIKECLVNNCSEKYLTAKVIAGFAKNEAFQQETPKEGWSNYLRKRDEILSELKEEFSFKKIKPLLEKLVEEGKLERSYETKKSTTRKVYHLLSSD